jgi:hypothetical protein
MYRRSLCFQNWDPHANWRGEKFLVSSSAAAALQQKNLKTLEIPNRKNSKFGGFFRVIPASTQTERHEDK